MNTKFEPILTNLLSRNAEIIGAGVASVDGIIISSVNLENNGTRLAAMAAASLGLGKQVVATVRAGTLSEVMISGDKGKVFIYAIGLKAVLVVAVREQPNVALINWEARKTVEELSHQV